MIWTLNHTVREVLPWYWGVYRWLSLTSPHVVYQIINRVLVISFLGIFIWLVLIIKERKLTRSDIFIGFLIVSSIIYFLVISIGDYLFHLKNSYSFGIQGRYFFPLVMAHMTLVLFGLRQIFNFLFKKYAKFGLLLIALLIIIFNDLSLIHVSSSYYDTSTIGRFIIEASQYKPAIFKGNNILIILTIAVTLQLVFLFSLSKYIIKQNESNRRNWL